MNREANRERQIFADAIDLSIEGRAACLQEACGADAELLRRVQALLDAHSDESPVLRTIRDPARGVRRTSEDPGTSFGRYKLLEKLGEGGCGVVYAAEQSEPVRRKVALKVIKPGMDTRSVIARFEAERQALAMMDHPNIAKIFDAGTTGQESGVRSYEPDVGDGQPGEGGTRHSVSAESHSTESGAPGGDASHPLVPDSWPLTVEPFPGRPYFVMELVVGERITDFARQKALSLPERLLLFLQVCAAVQHAHQKGVIHRDLKPSNILVAQVDSKPAPKVIDFGVAKALHGKLAKQTVATGIAQLIGTPAYMSPEQALLTSEDIDTRSDIYSLGVLLYELLAGSPPWSNQELLTAGLDGMRRIIREAEPERPSGRVARERESRNQNLRGERSKQPEAQGEAMESFSPLAHRCSSLAAQLPPIPTDLDWIVLKCLEKERARRYETANALAADIERHLNDEPVLARPPSSLYRLQKAVRRNTAAFAAGLVVVFVLMSGMAATSWQTIRARRAESAAKEQAERALAAERRAADEAATALAVKSFLTDQLFKANPYETPASNHANRRILLDEMAQAIEGKFPNQPLVELEIREALAVGLIGFGELAKVIHHSERMLELRRRQFPPGHSAILEDLGYLAMSYMGVGRLDKGEQLLAEIEPFLPAHGELSTGAAVGLMARAVLRQWQGRPGEGLPDIRRAVPVFRRDYGPTEHRVIHITWQQALMTHEAGQTQEAERLWSESLRKFENLLAPDHPAVARFLLGQAYTLRETRRPHQAIPLLERAISIFRRSFPENHHHLLDAEDVLARTLELTGNVAAAAKLYSGTYPHWLASLPTGVSINHSQSIAEFFERHGSPEKANEIWEALRKHEVFKSTGIPAQAVSSGSEATAEKPPR